jgi:hypothetical protein
VPLFPLPNGPVSGNVGKFLFNPNSPCLKSLCREIVSP